MRNVKKVPGYVRHPGSDWIGQNAASLPDREWVAVDRTPTMVDHDPSLEKLLKRLQSKKIPMEDTLLHFNVLGKIV